MKYLLHLPGGKVKFCLGGRLLTDSSGERKPIKRVFVTEFAKRSLIHASDGVTLKRHKTSFTSELLGQTVQFCKCNDRTVLLPNFKAVG